jgi:hypothetical protein
MTWILKCTVLDNRKLSASLYGNVVNTLNPKISGSSNWKVAMKSLSETELDGLIVMGLDVCHGRTQIEGETSNVALCSSIDDAFTKYHTELKTQPADRTEIVNDLGEMVVKVVAILYYYRQILVSIGI